MPLFDVNGKIRGSVGGFLDVTTRWRAEAALQSALDQLKLVTDNMSAGVTRCSREMKYVWASPTYAAWLGRKPEEIAGRPIIDIVGQKGYEAILPHMQKALSGERVEYERLVTFLGPGTRWLHAVYVPTREESGQVDGHCRSGLL